MCIYGIHVFFICACVGVHICVYCMWETEVDTRLHRHNSCTLFTEAGSLHQTQRTTIWRFSLVSFLLGIPYLCLQSSIRGVHHTHLECEFCGSKIQSQVCLARTLITESSPGLNLAEYMVDNYLPRLKVFASIDSVSWKRNMWGKEAYAIWLMNENYLGLKNIAEKINCILSQMDIIILQTCTLVL